MLLLFAISPFLLLFVLMAVFNRPAYISAPITALITVLGAYLLWGMDWDWIGASFLRALVITLDIILIVFGAIFLVAVLKRLGVFKPMHHIIASVSEDKRVQAILVGWFFVGFLEGIAGFGTPALLAIPILLAIGFKPLVSVVIALVGDSAAVVFGAIGVPISIGILQGVGLPLSEALALSSGVARTAALYNLVLSPIIPFILSVIAVGAHGLPLRRGFEIWKLAIFSGVIFMGISFLAANFLTPEFPTIVGSLVGGVIMVLLLKLGFFLPKRAIKISLEKDSLIQLKEFKKHILAISAKVFSPYILIIIMLFLTRMPGGSFGNFLREQTLTIENLFGTSTQLSINIINSPGIVFVLVALIFALIHRLSWRKMDSALHETLVRIAPPFLGLFFVIGIVQILLLSGNNILGLSSIPIYIAERLSHAGFLWPVFAPLVGMVGAFVSGSSTVSNLLFSSLQYTTAVSSGLSAVVILSLQAVGSASGNMVAIHNILAAQATAGLRDQEGRILRTTIVPALIYTFSAGVLGLIITLFF